MNIYIFKDTRIFIYLRTQGCAEPKVLTKTKKSFLFSNFPSLIIYILDIVTFCVVYQYCFLLPQQTARTVSGQHCFTLQQNSTWSESAMNCCATQEWFMLHVQKIVKACSHARWQKRKDSMHCRNSWYAMWKTWVSGNSDVHRNSRVSPNVSQFDLSVDCIAHAFVACQVTVVSSNWDYGSYYACDISWSIPVVSSDWDYGLYYYTCDISWSKQFLLVCQQIGLSLS